MGTDWPAARELPLLSYMGTEMAGWYKPRKAMYRHWLVRDGELWSGCRRLLSRDGAPATGNANRCPIRGAPPSMIHLPSGCSFHPRCDFAKGRCRVDDPMLRHIVGTNHQSACHFAEELENADLSAVHDWSQP